MGPARFFCAVPIAIGHQDSIRHRISILCVLDSGRPEPSNEPSSTAVSGSWARMTSLPLPCSGSA